MGPLSGLQIVEFAGIGPGPFCGTLLADLGADVLRVDRATPSNLGLGVEPRFDPLSRGRSSVCVDLKHVSATPFILELVSRANGLIEGFRPGVMERLGIGPQPCLARNPTLVYGRITGWGQDGPLANEVGHDINYIALSGALASIGPAGHKPVPPLNLIGDYGGGGMFLAFGMLAALHEASRSGQGQVVDAAMSEGAAYLTMPLFGWRSSGLWNAPRGQNLLDGGAPWYDTYLTSDKKWISIGAIEDKFYTQFLDVLGLDAGQLPDRTERANWPALRKQFEECFASHSRDEWCRRFEGKEACFAPVLEADELASHPQHRAREAFIDVGGHVQPAPAPRFSRTPAEHPQPARKPGSGGLDTLTRWGFDRSTLDALRDSEVINFS